MTKNLQISLIIPKSPAKPNTFVTKKARKSVSSNLSNKFFDITLSVAGSQSIGTGIKPSCIIGITLVDQVIAEKPILSPDSNFPKFLASSATRNH